MSDAMIEDAPTSTATTRTTEPEVVAAVSSAEGTEDRPLSFRSESAARSLLRTPMMFAAGAVLGYAAYHWLRRRG